jgi:2'-5' RNA ligase
VSSSEPHALAFPAQLPSSLTDPAVIREHDWNAFSELPSMTNHWERPGWRPGRRSYHWLLTFDDEPALQELARRCQQGLRHLPLDLVPLDSLHLTLRRVGFTDELTPQRAHAVAKAVSERCQGLPPFPLAVGPLAGSRGAIRFSISPWDGLIDIRQRLHAEATDIVDGGRPPRRVDTFRPHISIAYCDRDLPLAPVLQAMVPLRRLAPVKVLVHTINLVVLRREGRAYRWRVQTRVPLGAGSASMPEEGQPGR